MDAEGKGENAIARELHTNRTKIYLVIDKALSFGVEKAIKDLSGRGKKRTIGNEGRSFIMKDFCLLSLMFRICLFHVVSYRFQNKHAKNHTQ